MPVFTDFFFKLRERGVPVSIHEWLTLQEALGKGLARSNLLSFYYLARAILVKSETYFDRFDLAFREYFQGIETPEEIIDEIIKGLEKVPELVLTEEEKKLLEELDLEQVRRNFEEQWRKGRYHGHVGGNQAIGTGGTSTQGAFGYNPAGVRVGQGYSRHRSAIQIAEKRRFRNYDKNVILDTRQLQVALSKLRTLLPLGEKDEIDVEGSIDATCRNAGELELVWKRGLTNAAKLLLLMDTGGSMEVYTELVNRLFSAASAQFRDLKYFYFHNCIYQDLWKDMERSEVFPTEELLRTFESDYKVIIVGDASMAPSELLEVNGAIDYWYYNDTPGIIWLKRIAEHFPYTIWLNPIRRTGWRFVRSIGLIADIFPMYELSVEGLESGIKYLLTRNNNDFNKLTKKSLRNSSSSG